MVQTDTSNNSSKQKKIVIISIAALVVVIGAVTGILLARRGYLANTMRLLRVEGTVNIEDSKGGSKPVIDNLRFQSGDALNTGADGLASVGLDDTKIITLDHDSRAEFKKKNKQLELKLTKGAVFFNVTEKLKDDEKFEIKTSNMTAGIRGTSGVVLFDPRKNNIESLAVTDGSVGITAVNQVTKEVKSTVVAAGQQIHVYLFNNKPKDSIEFKIEPISEENLLWFALNCIAADDALMSRVTSQTPLKPDRIRNLAKGPYDAMGYPKLNSQADPPADPQTDPQTDPKPEPKPEPQPDPQPPKTEDPENKPENPPDKKPANKPKPKRKKPDTKNKKKKKKKKSDNKNKDNKKETTDNKNRDRNRKQNSAPSIPDGWTKYQEGWGSKYGGHRVYIIHKDNEEFKGYLNNRWIGLSVDFDEDSTGQPYMVFYYGGSSKYYRHKVTFKFEEMTR